MSKKISELPNQTSLDLNDKLVIVRSDEELIGNREAAMGDMYESLDNVHVKGDRLRRPLYESVYSDIRYNRSIVSLRFDDGPIADHTTIFPLLTARNLVASFAVISDDVVAGAGLSSVECLEMQEAGMEFCGHSKTHGVDPSDFDEFVAETTGARDTLNGLGINISSFVQPGTWVDEHDYDDISKINTKAGRELRNEFAAFFAYIYDEDALYRYSLPHRHRFGVNKLSGDTQTLVQLQARLDAAISLGAGLIILFHTANIDSGGGNISLADFTTFLDYIETQVDTGLLDNLTMTSQLFAQKSSTKINYLYDPDFELSATGAWLGWEIVAGVPQVVGGGRTGNCAQIDGTKYIQQSFATKSMRSCRVKAWAKSSDGTNVTATLRVRDTADVSRLDISESVVVGAVWTEIVLEVGMHIDTPSIHIRLWQTAGAADTLYDDISLEKI